MLRPDPGLRGALVTGRPARGDEEPLCYCFGFTHGDVRRQVTESGTSDIPARIEAGIRARLCRCATLNPSGRCCLGEVKAAVAAAQAARGEDGR